MTHVKTENALAISRRTIMYNGFNAADVTILERLSPDLKLTFPRNSWNTPLRTQVQAALAQVQPSHPVAPIKFNHTTLVVVEIGDTVDVVCEAYNARIKSGIDEKISSLRAKAADLYKDHLGKLGSIEKTALTISQWLAGLEVFWSFVEFDKKSIDKVSAFLTAANYKPSKSAPKAFQIGGDRERYLRSVINYSLGCLSKARVPKAIHWWLKQVK